VCGSALRALRLGLLLHGLCGRHQWLPCDGLRLRAPTRKGHGRAIGRGVEVVDIGEDRMEVVDIGEDRNVMSCSLVSVCCGWLCHTDEE
jgi:hypothetical protein